MRFHSLSLSLINIQFGHEQAYVQRRFKNN